jgi:hypothetical protein
MDRSVADWEQAYESAGVWPIAVELPPDEVAYLLWYRRPKWGSRLLTADGRVIILGDLSSLAGLLDDARLTAGPSEPGWDAVRHLSALVGPHVPAEETIPRRLIGQSLEWLQSRRPASLDQAEELLNCIDLMNDWHNTLRDMNLTGPWPLMLDGAASILDDAVIWGDSTPAAAFRRVTELGIWPIMERLLSDLMRLTVVLSSKRPAA